MNAARVKLITVRKERKMTQEEVSKKAGISRAYLTNIEAGKHTPSLEVARKLSTILDTSIEDLF